MRFVSFRFRAEGLGLGFRIQLMRPSFADCSVSREHIRVAGKLDNSSLLHTYVDSGMTDLSTVPEVQDLKPKTDVH